MSECRWLEPRMVAALEFAEWTSTNHLRRSKFVALREDEVLHEALVAEGLSTGEHIYRKPAGQTRDSILGELGAARLKNGT